MPVKEVEVLSNKFWTLKEKDWNDSLLVSMNTSMVRLSNKYIHLLLSTTDHYKIKSDNLLSIYDLYT